MEPGLRLLTQLVLEFTPLMTNFWQKQSSNQLNSNISRFSTVTEEFLQTINTFTQNESVMNELIQPKYSRKEIGIYNNVIQLKICREQQQTAIKIPEVQKILDNWPLKLYPTQILDSAESCGYTPLKIFFVPPKINFDQFEQNSHIGHEEIEVKLAEGLREFINTHYSLHHPERPCEFLAGAWKDGSFYGESSIKALFNSLKSQPTLVLESENDGDYFNIHIGYWGWGQTSYYYQTISRLSYREILQESAKNRALAWKKVRDQLLALGEDLSEVNKLGGDNVANLEIWEKLEKWQVQGIDTSQLSLKYQVNQQDFAQLCQILINCHCLVLAWIADAYHLVQHNVQPLLPTLLPGLLKEGLDLASLAAMLFLAARIEDEAFVVKLREYFTGIGDRQSIADTEQVLTQIELLKNKRQFTSVPVLYTLNKHFAKVSSVAISPDGKTLISGCFDQTVNFWDLQNGRLIRSIQGNLGEIAAVAVSRDGNFLAVGSCEPQSNVKVWDLKTGKLLHTLSGHQKPVNVVVISPGGQILASGSNKVKIWDLPKAERICTLWHSNTVNAIAISVDGNILASGSADSKIRLWNPRNGDPIRTIPSHTQEVTSIAIHPDGKTLFSGSADTKIKIWDLWTGKLLNTLTGHLDKINSIIVSPDGQFLWSGSDDTTIKMWNIATGEVLQTLKGHFGAVNSLALSLDGKLLASGSSDKTIKVWELP